MEPKSKMKSRNRHSYGNEYLDIKIRLMDLTTEARELRARMKEIENDLISEIIRNGWTECLSINRRALEKRRGV